MHKPGANQPQNRCRSDLCYWWAQQTTSQQTTCTITALHFQHNLHRTFLTGTHISYSVHSFPQPLRWLATEHSTGEAAAGKQTATVNVNIPNLHLENTLPLSHRAEGGEASRVTHVEMLIGLHVSIMPGRALLYHLNIYLQALLRFFRLEIKLLVNTYILIYTYISKTY